jgi:hypothetical protein
MDLVNRYIEFRCEAMIEVWCTAVVWFILEIVFKRRSEVSREHVPVASRHECEHEHEHTP